MLGMRKGARNAFSCIEAKTSESVIGHHRRAGVGTEGCASDVGAQSPKNEEVLVRIRKHLNLVSLEVQRLVEGHQSEIAQLLEPNKHLKSQAAAKTEETVGAALNQVSPSSSEKSLESLSGFSEATVPGVPSTSDQEKMGVRPPSMATVRSTLGGPPPLDTQQDAGRTNKKVFRDKLQKRLNWLKDAEDGQSQSGHNGRFSRGSGRGHEMQAILPDAASMKEMVREAVSRPEYSVANFYHKTGICQGISRHPWFELITLTVIAFNAAWVAIDIEYNDEPILSNARPVFQIAEHSFCAFFLAEWTIRFLSFSNKRDSLRDAWFVFDSILAFIYVCDAWLVAILVAVVDFENQGGLGNTSFLRLFTLVRLTRMARLVRILKAVPEMLIVMKGVGVALRSVFFTLCLLTVILYVFAISFRVLTIDSQLGELFFASVPSAMLSLLLGGVLPEYESTVRRIGKADLLLGLLFGAFMFITAITLMNFLIGVLVEAVSAVSASEKEQLTAKYVKARMTEFLEKSGIDKDGNKHLSKDEFEEMLLDPATALTMQHMGVDVVGLVEFSEMLFQGDNELAFPDFVRLVLQLRGTNPSTVKDIVDLRKFLLQELDSLEEYVVQVIRECMPKQEAPTTTEGMPEPEGDPEEEAKRRSGPRVGRRTSAGNPVQRLGSIL